MMGLLELLLPIMRSITGAGIRETLERLGEVHPFDRVEVPSGTRVLDWTVPKEWVVRSARLTAPDGSVVCDVADHPLHLLNYSAPVAARVDRAELDEHLFSLPDRPHAIPYITSYYAERWGFCLPHEARLALPEGAYDVRIDTGLVDGALTYAETMLPGESDDEVLFSSFACHPGMANDELCGLVVLAHLARRLAAWPGRRKSYRIVLVPETIGSICLLAAKGEHLKRHVVAGYTVANVGRRDTVRYKRSRRGDSLADRAMRHVLSRERVAFEESPFAPIGSDERQYCSPGFDLPVGAITRSPQFFPEYHNSDDTLDKVPPAALVEMLDLLEKVCAVLDGNASFVSDVPYGEPQLGRRGLYPTIGTTSERESRHLATLWLLNYADGEHDLLSVAEMSGLPFAALREAADLCLAAGIIHERPSGVASFAAGA